MASSASNGSSRGSHSGQRGGRGHARQPESSKAVLYSKVLSKILRHRAKEEGLQIRADGFIRVDELLDRPKLKGLDFDLLQKLVLESDKQRFSLQSEAGADGQPLWWIKANQGHSIELENLELRRVENAAEIPVVLHGTFKRHWPAISREGLKRMSRTHIHCASGRFGEEGVISGVRKSCNLFIYIDVEKAMADGIEFFLSPNGVILTKGIDGTLSPSYFSKTVDREERPKFHEHRPGISDLTEP